MAGKPIATLGSMHVCPMCSGPVPHVGGPISGPGAPNVLINKKPVALMGDMCVCVGPPDVVAQGHPLVKANGVPVVCVGDLTAHGGAITMGEPTVMIGAAVPTPSKTMPKEKIPFPKITSENRAIAALSGHSLTEAEENIAALQEIAEETPVSEESEEVTFKTTFPQDQLHQLASNTTLFSFLKLFISIYGIDIPTKAYEELFNDAKENTIKEPTWVVKKKVPYTGKALFYNNKEEEIQEIWVDENFIKEATVDIDTSGELLAAIVEEYGHWLDYLLRNSYAETERPDALRDEGAQFSYKIIGLNSANQKDQQYADATITGASHQLVWDYEPLHKNIQAFVNEARWYEDDNFGSFEFYKAGFLKGENNFGHGDIEREGLTQSYIKSELDDKVKIGNDEDLIADYLLNIYFGNWMRDFSQGLDPFTTRILSNTLNFYSEERSKENTIGTIKDKYNLGKLLTETVTYDQEVSYKIDTKVFGIYDLKIKPVKGAMKVICTLLEMIAAKEFIYDPIYKAKTKENLNYNQYLKELKQNYDEISLDTMGVVIQAEHIDNPRGVGDDILIKYTDRETNKEVEVFKKNDDNKLYKGFMGSLVSIERNKDLHDINTAYGMKNYIRNENTGRGKDKPHSDDGRYTHSHTYILDKLKLACVTGAHDKTLYKQVHHDLGAALHTLEDFFAHSNYAELALIKAGFTRVFPWVTQVSTEIQGVKKEKIDGEYKIEPIYKNKKLDYIKYRLDETYRDEVIEDKEGIYTVVENAVGVGKHNQLVTKIPLVTGTFGQLDTVASVLPIIVNFFKSHSGTTDQEEAVEKAEKAKKAHHKNSNKTARAFGPIGRLHKKNHEYDHNDDHDHHSHDHDSEDDSPFFKALNITTRSFEEVLALEVLRDLLNDEGCDDHEFVTIFQQLLKIKDIYETSNRPIEKIKEFLEMDSPFVELYEYLEDKATEQALKLIGLDEVIKKVIEPIKLLFYNVLISIPQTISSMQVIQAQEIKKLQQSVADGTFRIDIGMDPTHTQVAKDDIHHPMHGLSAQLAIEAVSKIGTLVFKTWIGGSDSCSFSDVEAEINEIMRHPAQTTWQDETVKEWITKNRKAICDASNPSAVINGLLHLNEDIRKLLKELNNVELTPLFKEIEAVAIKSHESLENSENQPFVTFRKSVDTVLSKLNSAESKIEELKNDWNNKFPEPWYCDSSTRLSDYKVKRGDTLSQIALNHDTTIEDLLELNPRIDPVTKKIYAGGTIIVPNPKSMDINFNYLKG